MAQSKSNKRDVSGWLILNKPYDMTSTQAVGKVRWLFGAKKAGHAGTLDPLATGILPIALGEATKTVSAIQDGEKLYRFTIKWGEETTTDDAEGEVVERSDVRPDADGDPRHAAGLHRRNHADAAGLFGHQGRRRAGLRPGAGRRRSDPRSPAGLSSSR